MASDYAGNYWSSYPNVAGSPNWATTNSAVAPMPQQQDPSIINSRRLLAALGVRWGLHEYEPMPFQHLHAYESEGKVCLLVVNNGQSTLLEDDSGSFPCDLLLTKLKLLAG